MAKVISWILDRANGVRQYVYLGTYEGGQPQDPTISTSEISKSELNDLSYFWVTQGTLVQYRACYSKMYTAVNGSTTNLNPPGSDGSGADIYFNVLNEKGVMIVSGKDGKSDDEPGSSYYNIHNLNQNIAIGLGGDYVLDVDVTARTEIYIEREGIIKNNMISAIRISELASSKYAYTISGDKVLIDLCISNGTSFAESPHNKQYTIVVETTDGYTGYTYFTVTGVKNGAEGAYFNLLITPKIIKKIGDTYSDSLVDVDYTSNEDPENFAIKYLTESGYAFLPEEYKRVSPKYQIPASFIDAFTSKTITLGLFYEGDLIDSDCCSITKDGEDASGRVVVELDNEMDGIALGDDNVLDTDLSVGSGARLWSGGSEASITKVILKGISRTDNVDCSVKNGSSWVTHSFNASKRAEFTITATDKAEFKINFKDGFVFDNYRETITVELQGNFNGIQITGETNYVVIGVKGGKDGDVFRLQPSVDVVAYDPNVNAYSQSVLTCRAFIGMEEILDFNQPNSDYRLWGSVNFAYQTYEELVSEGTTLFTSNIYTFPNDSGTTTVTFYLLYKIGEGENDYFIVDRETVPVVKNGLNGSDRVYLEIEDEIDPVSLGGDYQLDTETTFETSFTLYSGDTKVEYDKISIEVSDDTLNGKECWIYTQKTGERVPGHNNKVISNRKAEFPLSSPAGHSSLYLKFGGDGEAAVPFGGDHKKRITITAHSGNSMYSAIYTIIGIKEGADGVTYELRPTVTAAVYDPTEGAYSPVSISCSAYVNAEQIPDHLVDPNSPFYITYTLNTSVDRDDAYNQTTPLPSTGINLMQAGGTDLERVFFYLFYKLGENEWIMLDRESVPIVTNGKDGINGTNASRTYLELDEEITGIAVGDDGKLDENVTVNIPMALYSGTTKLTFTSLEIEGDTEPEADFANCPYTISENGTEVDSGTFDSNSKATYTGDLYDVEVSITLNAPFLFGEGSRRIVTFTATYDGIQYAATYTIIGLKAGVDGVVYRLVPNANSVIDNPNNTGNNRFNPRVLTCDAYEGGNQIVFPSQHPVSSDTFQIRYTTANAPGDSTGNTLPYDSTGVTIDESIKRVYFYLFIKYGQDSWLMLDRESVPVLSDGINASERIYLELDNEVTGVGLGNDGDLDTAVPLEIPFTLYSGSTPINMTNVKIETEASLNGVVCNLYYNGQDHNETFANGVVEYDINSSLNISRATAKLTLPIGLQFINSSNKTLKFTATHGASTYEARYTIIGINGGADGQVFRLMPDTNIIIYNPNTQAYTPDEIYCEAYAGPDKIVLGEGSDYEIRYSTGATPVAYSHSELLNESSVTPDITYQYIYFYLYLYDNNVPYLLDREGVPIARDGADAQTHAYLELANEMDGVGLGENPDGTMDTILNVNTDLEIPFSIFSGLTNLPFNEVEIELDSVFNVMPDCKLSYGGTTTPASTFTGSTITYTISPAVTDATATITIKSGLEFDSPYRKVLIFRVTDSINSGVYTARYTILGVPGGEDGSSFRLVPDANIIVKNPNVSTNKFYPQTLGCVAYNNTDLLDTTGNTPPYLITYSVNTPLSQGATGTPIGAGVTIEGASPEVQRVYFYLVAKDDGASTYSAIIDKESVPVVVNGTNASDRVFLELDEEMTGIALGAGDFTLNTPVSVTIPFGLYSGATRQTINNLSITAETRFSGFNCTLYSNGTQIASGAFNSSGRLSLSFTSTSNLISAVITLQNGLVFDASLRKELTFGVIYNSVLYNALYTIIGIQGGKDGTSFRLSPSVSTIHKIVNGSTTTYDPNKLYCSAYANTEQLTVGTTLGTDDYIIAYDWYLRDNAANIPNQYIVTSEGLNILSDNRIYLYLLYRTGTTAAMSSYIIIDRESVPVLKDGEDGTPGSAGLQGQTIRGPYNWYDISGITMAFYDGSSGSSVNPPYFLDILVKDGVFYYCNTTHTHNANVAWTSESQFWTQSDATYNFVATNLLLASAASINFLSNNELYLMDNNVITGGAKGGGSSDIIFWAGTSGATADIDNAPFRVYGDGSIYATKGTFEGSVRIPYIHLKDLGIRTGYFGSGYYAGDNPYIVYNRGTAQLSNGFHLYYRDPDLGYDYSDSYFFPSLYLMEPSSGINGYTYKIVVDPDIRFNTTLRATQPTLVISTLSYEPSYVDPIIGNVYGDEILDLSRGTRVTQYQSITSPWAAVIGFFGGYLELTCIYSASHDKFVWAITNCTGPLSYYGDVRIDQQTLYHGAYWRTSSPVFGLSTLGWNKTISLINADSGATLSETCVLNLNYNS